MRHDVEGHYAVKDELLSSTAHSPSAPVPPIMLTLPRAVAVSGMSRSAFYRIAQKEPRLLRKFGRRTLVDYRLLTALLDALPIARLRNPHSS